MKKSTLSFLALALQPVAYPACAIYHAIVGSTIWWLCQGAPSSYSFSQVALSAGISIVLGWVLTLVVGKKEQA